ncbi:MAG: DUF4430 domain-containing protein [Anaerovoracaceae bacterium]
MKRIDVRRKKLIFGAAAVMLLLFCVIAAGVTLARQKPFSPRDDSRVTDPARSQVLVTGEGYHIDKNQQKIRKKIEKKRKKVVEKNYQYRISDTAPASDTGRDEPRSYRDDSSGNELTDPSDDSDAGGGDQAGDEKSPVIKTSSNIINGRRMNGTFLSFWVTASDHRGNDIPVRSVGEGHFEVFINGTQIYSTGLSGRRTSFRADKEDGLVNGTNTVTIKVTDKDGRNAVFTRTIFMNTKKAASPSGEITISVSAGSIGIGGIASGTVKIYHDEQLSYAIDRFMKAKGLTYRYTGSMKSGLHITSIGRSGLTNGWDYGRIPQSVRDGLDERHIYFNKSKPEGGMITEKDITNTSGWLYYVNGEYMNYGISSRIPDDGDEVTLVFTLTGQGDDADGTL